MRPPPARGSSRCEIDAAQHAGEDRADLLLLARGEELDHAADRLGRVDRVHRREDEMARLGGLERRLGRLGVAELADQDHVGVLAERAAKRLRERLGVEPDLALVDDARRSSWRISIGSSIVTMCCRRRAVDVVDHRGERRRLARAGGAGDEDEAALLLGEPLDAGGQAELSKSGTSRGMTRKANEIAPRWRKALTRKRGRPSGAVGDVELAGLLKRLVALAARRGDRAEHLVEVASSGSESSSGSMAVAADEGRPAELQVDVGRPEVDGTAQQRVQVHRLPMSAASRYCL